MKNLQLPLLLLCGLLTCSCQVENRTIWKIGQNNNSSSEFALAPKGYDSFLDHDFGWEDRYFLIGTSDETKDWPYVLPGPSDTWGGTWPTSGWRSHVLNILFGLDQLPSKGNWKLIVDIQDTNPEDPPLLKVTINGHSWKYQLPKGKNLKAIEGDTAQALNYLVEIPIDKEILKKGGNEINLTTLKGSWLIFDQVRLEGPGKARLQPNNHAFLRTVQPADYEISDADHTVQPLLIDVEHLSGHPELSVKLDGEVIFTETLESGSYVFEAPMPGVTSPTQSTYQILVDGQHIQSGEITRGPKEPISLADYADTKIGTAHSRWMITPGPWMPFSMVKLSPDNQNEGWQAGYDPIFESIGGFSHIHEWTLSGLLTMPTNGKLITQVGDQNDPDSGYRSRLNKSTEKAAIGYYKADLTDYGITAELTATTRCSFQRYSFPKDKNGSRILVDLQNPSEYNYQLKEILIRKKSDTRIEGFSKQFTPNTWSGGISQEYTIHFVMEFDKPMKSLGFWSDKGIIENTPELHLTNCADAGAFIQFDTQVDSMVQVRTGISYVSIENASQNLEEEITNPFGWDFERIRKHHQNTWNDLFNRVKITTSDRREKVRFYTNMYRALCSRNTYSDVDGSWVDAGETIRKLKDPTSPALGCDAFWNTFWNLNQFWNLVTPEWSNRWVNSQLAMYDANGWLAKGPAGMEYIPVMVAEHEIPLIVSAYQMGIRDFDVEKAFQAAKKMQTTPAREVGGGFAGNRDLEAYLKYHYVPYDKGRFSNTMEYSYDDWTVAQLAKSLGKTNDYNAFLKRGYYWQNVIDHQTGYARLKDSKGNWALDFDPYQSGANHHYVEGNAWQLTFFAPQDVPRLAEAIGKERFIERLEWGFTESDKTRFNGKNDQYWNYPVVQGNQQSMHFAFLFNWVGKPWLTQHWSRAIMERYYGYGLANAYLGDEDQGQMSAWFIMASLGLFQTDGGCRAEPIYEIASPLYSKIEIDLGNRYGRGEKFTIEARNASRLNKYVQRAVLNGKELNTFQFPAKELLKGGSLILEMGATPNKKWGISSKH